MARSDELTPDKYLSMIYDSLEDTRRLYGKKIPGVISDTDKTWVKAMNEIGVEDSEEVRAAVIRTLMFVYPDGKTSRDSILNKVSLLLTSVSSHGTNDDS